MEGQAGASIIQNILLKKTGTLIPLSVIQEIMKYHQNILNDFINGKKTSDPLQRYNSAGSISLNKHG